MSSGPFLGYAERVAPEDTQAGHLTVGNFVSMFDRATDAFRDWLGVGTDYGTREGRSIVVAEAHLIFRSAVQAGQGIRVHSRLLGCDRSRLHAYHEARGEQDAKVLFATSELALVHVDRESGRPLDFAPDVLRRLQERMKEAADPLPEYVGRSVRRVASPQ